METPDLVVICTTSFLAVLLLLSLLAILMRALMAIFPAKEEGNDQAVIAAINTAYNNIYPGSKIIKIGEEK